MIPQINHERNQCGVCGDKEHAFGYITTQGWLCGDHAQELQQMKAEEERNREQQMIAQMKARRQQKGQAAK